MKRFFDLTLALVAMLFLLLPIIMVAVLVKLTSKGPTLYWSDRVGRYNTIFKMPKFRSMEVDSPLVATHLLEDPQSLLTPIGNFLRKSSLDELPQLYSILMGHMSFVGPRPALFNQDDLIELRTRAGVHVLTPGLTGWAQVNGRNAISWKKKFELDVWYVENQSFALDIKVLFLTLQKVVQRKGITSTTSVTVEPFNGEN